MFLIFVPALIGWEAPFTGKFLIVITVSPFCSATPFESLIIRASESLSGASDIELHS